MADCGIERIDGLRANGGAGPIITGDPDRAAVGAVQDLLSGQGNKGLPGLLSPLYGTFGPKTAEAVRQFRVQHGLGDEAAVDTATLRQLIATPAPDPLACRAYVPLVLDLPYSGMNKILTLVAQMEGQGRFAALNCNSDRCGLSFGIIQWAQKPRRLPDILIAFRAADPQAYARLFGAGDAALADAMLAHTQKTGGGVDPQTGQTTDPSFDLIAEPWVSRFRAAAASQPYQAVQVRVAQDAFNSFLAKLRQFAPQLVSERAVAFMLDLANQHGESGARSIFTAVFEPAMTEKQLLEAMLEESVRRMSDFKDATRRRRETFLATALLSDDPFPG